MALPLGILLVLNFISISMCTYLGSDIDSDGYSCPEIHGRLGIAGSIVAQLDKVWRRRGLGLSARLRVCTSLVQSVVLYGSETWTMRKVDSDRIQSFHMQALRRILGIRLLLLLNEYYLHAVKQKSCKSMLQT